MSNILTSITFDARAARDPELETLPNGTKHVRLSMIQNKGFTQENEHALCFSCNFYGSNAERLTKAGVKTGTVLTIIGDFDSKEYFRKDPKDPDPNSTVKTYHDRSLEVNVLSWGFAPQNKAGNDQTTSGAAGTNQRTNPQQMPPAQNYTPAQNTAPQQNYPQAPPQQAPMQQGYPQSNGQASYQQGNMYQQPTQQFTGAANGFSSIPQQQLPFPN